MATKTKSALFLALFLISLACIGIYAGLSLVAGRTKLVSVYGINTTVLSSDDYHHSISVDFDLDIDASYANKIDRQHLKKIITDAVSSLDYDKLTKVNSMDYIKEEVSNYISNVVPKDKIKDIYISKITTDINDSNEQENDNIRSDRARGIFKKMK